MEYLQKLINLIRDPGPLITWGGYPGLALIIFLETGALVFFLPGDSLLFVAGLYASNGLLNIALLNAILIPCAIIGDAVSYFIGKKIGPALFRKPKSRIFNPAHLRTAHEFYVKHGGKAIIMARFVPIIRTFVPVIAGMAGMQYRRFAMFNVVGGISWIVSMTVAGYLLGSRFPILAKKIDLVIVVIVVLSVSPMLIAWWNSRRKAQQAP